jgi:DNA-binding transcriptional LysR family regulator
MKHFSQIVVFVRAAEHLSFATAGRAIGISASAVGKAISKLERALDVRLFQRTTRKVALTEEGELLYQYYRRAIDELDEAEAVLARTARAPRGRIKVSLPTIGYRFLVKEIPEFQRRYPEVALDIDFNDRIVDLIEDGVDVAIRSGDLADSAMMSRRLGEYRFLVCASPDYLRRAGTPRSAAELPDHTCLRFRYPSTGKLQDWELSEGALTGRHARESETLVCNNMEGLRAAAIAGLGLAYMPDFLVTDAIRDGRLTSVLHDRLPPPRHFSILWQSNRQLSPRIRAFVDFVCGRVLKPER